ncbi:hypothetical protein ACPCVL_13890 [Streptomyces koyangensis]|uniref:hypothetical protein n=1 Tax=Streptomyces koyangensis TaxID=188770 RepID=UPI003C2F70F8
MGYLPAPRLHRIAKVIAIDPTHRIALLPPEAGHPKWTLPQRPALLGDNYTDTAYRLCRDLFPVRPMRIGTVTGHRWASAPERATLRREERFHIVRVAAGSADEISGKNIFWTPRAALDLWLDHSEVETVKVLTDGYLDGWLPDGPITLD